MPNPALSDLETLVGQWRIELTNAEFIEPDAVMSGAMSVEWLDDVFLVLRSSFEEGGPPASVSVVGRNEAREDYEVLYADDRGVSRIYRMTFEDRVWRQHREDPGFHQRFEGLIDAAGNSLTGTWTRSHDGGDTWRHDFDLTYTRLRTRPS